jgi:hypothetical protein
MATVLHPWQILVAAMAGWITRQQDAVIDYLREENRVLKKQLGRKRLRLTDEQRRRLAVRGKAIGRRALTEVASLVAQTRFFVGIGGSLHRNGPMSGALPVARASWKSSPTWSCEWLGRIHGGATRESKARSTTLAIGLVEPQSPTS